MTAIAVIVSPGLQTTVQDAGRRGFRHLGVPLAGAADALSLACANAALGNPPNAAALECALSGPTLRFEREIACCIAGADMDARLNGAALESYRPFVAKSGDRLALAGAQKGARAYIAFHGGVAGEVFLKSASTYAPAGLGGVEGRALRAGDRLYGAALAPRASCEIPPPLRLKLTGDFVLRATAGPDAARLDDGAAERFFADAFTVDARSSRMGARLTGRIFAPACRSAMKSSAVFPGTVQCPPDGRPILLLVDAQTTGGYLRIAQVIAADAPLAGQIRPGDRVWFRKISASQARDVTRKKEALVRATLPDFSFY